MKDQKRNKRKATFTLPAADKAVVRMGAGVNATAIEMAEKQQTTAEKIEQLVLPTIHCRVSKGMGMLFAGVALLSIFFFNGWFGGTPPQNPFHAGAMNSALLLVTLFYLITPYRPNPIVIERDAILFPSILFIGKGRRLHFNNIRSAEIRIMSGRHGQRRMLYVFLEQGRTYKISELQLQTSDSTLSKDTLTLVKDYLTSQSVLTRVKARQ